MATHAGAGMVPVSLKNLKALCRFIEDIQSSLYGLSEEVVRAMASAQKTARTLATLVDELMEGA
ncbi:hypothetical protein [Desulfosoma sp.]|uniref:hypothetical protein n=2 Tax=Desulfosoma sp. TaxID=2603217 RepID=UPI00404AA942